jgi:hypothetical protein
MSFAKRIEQKSSTKSVYNFEELERALKDKACCSRPRSIPRSGKKLPLSGSGKYNFLNYGTTHHSVGSSEAGGEERGSPRLP